MDDISNFQNDHKTKPPKPQQQDEDHQEEETLSLCDFPLNSPSKNRDSFKTQDRRRSASEPSDFFEFFNIVGSEMIDAEDIIFRGKLIPLRNHQILKSLSADHSRDLSRRYIESARKSNISELTRSIVIPTADCKKHRRKSSPPLVKSEPSDVHRSSSRGSARSSEGSKAVWRSRWFVFMFGPLKVNHREMDLRDMKTRQVRRSHGSMFAGGKFAAGRSDRRSSWGQDLLRVLSCRSHASVAVTASIGVVSCHDNTCDF